MLNNIKLINIIFIFFIISVKLPNNYIILPFEFTNSKLIITNDDPLNFVTKFLFQINTTRIYSKIQIGEHKKDIIMFFTLDDSYFRILKDFCLKENASSYIKYFFGNIRKKWIFFFRFRLIDTKIANDIISFYKDSKLKEKLDIDFNFLIVNETKNDYIGYIHNSYCGK